MVTTSTKKKTHSTAETILKSHTKIPKETVVKKPVTKETKVDFVDSVQEEPHQGETKPVPLPKNSKKEEKVTISDPVKATPIPQRKIVEERRPSTFGLSKERDQFIENLSMLVLSGMSIVGAIASIIKQTKSPGMKKFLSE